MTVRQKVVNEVYFTDVDDFRQQGYTLTNQ